MKHKKLFLIWIFIFVSMQLVATELIWDNYIYYEIEGVTAKVTFPKKNLNDNFAQPYNHTSLTIPETITYNGLSFTVTSIGANAFKNSPIRDINLPNSLQHIGSMAFSNCNNLIEIVLPPNISSVWPDAFDGCNYLRTIINTSRTEWVRAPFSYVPTYPVVSYSFDNEYIPMISFAENEFIYTGEAPILSWTNNIEGYTATLQMPVLNTNVGSYNVTIPATFRKGTKSFSANIYYKYTIKKAKLNVSVNNVNREYGEDNPTFEIIYSGLQNGDNESSFSSIPIANTTATKESNVGEYPITVSGGKATNFDFSYESGILTFSQALLEARVRDVERFYGEQNPSFSIEFHGLKNNEISPNWKTPPTIQTEANKYSNVGQYKIKAIINEADINYNLENIEDGILSIKAVPLTITAKNLSRLYYSENPTLEYTYRGFVNGDNENSLLSVPIISTLATKYSNVGTYDIIISGASSENYNITFVNGKLTIAARSLTISSKDCEKFYKDDNPTFEIIYSGFVGDENETVLSNSVLATCDANKYSNAGRYIIQLNQTSATNYNINYRNGWLIIKPRTLTISTKDYERFYRESNPQFEIIYSGFVEDEDESVLTTKATTYCEATQYSNAGRYPIYVRSANAINYSMDYRNGYLTIKPLNQNITWDQEFKNVKVGDQIELTATASSGLPVSYEISDPTMATTYTFDEITYLNLKQAGTIVIQARQNGNTNYNEAARITKTIRINNDTGISNYTIRPEDGPYTIYDLLGRQLNEFKPGVNIIRFANGTTKKVVITNLTM